MGPIIPAIQKRNYANEFAQAMSSGLEGYLKSQDQAQELALNEQRLGREDEALSKLGIESKGVRDPKLRELLVANMLKGQQKEKELLGKEQEKIQPLQGALKTIDRMRQIGKKNNLGLGSSFFSLFYPEVRQDMGEYETLGKSLIQFASNIPIRNRQEFETLAHGVYDPTISDSRRQGILNALQSIIENSLTDAGDDRKVSDNILQHKKERPPLSSFMRNK